MLSIRTIAYMFSVEYDTASNVLIDLIAYVTVRANH